MTGYQLPVSRLYGRTPSPVQPTVPKYLRDEIQPYQNDEYRFKRAGLLSEQDDGFRSKQEIKIPPDQEDDVFSPKQGHMPNQVQHGGLGHNKYDGSPQAKKSKQPAMLRYGHADNSSLRQQHFNRDMNHAMAATQRAKELSANLRSQLGDFKQPREKEAVAPARFEKEGETKQPQPYNGGYETDSRGHGPSAMASSRRLQDKSHAYQANGPYGGGHQPVLYGNGHALNAQGNAYTSSAPAKSLDETRSAKARNNTNHAMLHGDERLIKKAKQDHLSQMTTIGGIIEQAGALEGPSSKPTRAHAPRLQPAPALKINVRAAEDYGKQKFQAVQHTKPLDKPQRRIKFDDNASSTYSLQSSEFPESAMISPLRIPKVEEMRQGRNQDNILEGYNHWQEKNLGNAGPNSATLRRMSLGDELKSDNGLSDQHASNEGRGLPRSLTITDITEARQTEPYTPLTPWLERDGQTKKGGKNMVGDDGWLENPIIESRSKPVPKKPGFLDNVKRKARELVSPHNQVHLFI